MLAAFGGLETLLHHPELGQQLFGREAWCYSRRFGGIVDFGVGLRGGGMCCGLCGWLLFGAPGSWFGLFPELVCGGGHGGGNCVEFSSIYDRNEVSER
jgi:hypothetical protein